MSVTVSTPVYEGPFDLLLNLILREEVELYEVSLSSIVDAYLAELENLGACDLEVTTEFLLIAAILLELKTRRLLPTDDRFDVDDEFGLWEERDLLLARLLECKTFKDAAIQLRRLAADASLSWPRRAGLEDAFLHLAPVDLRDAGRRALAPKPVFHIDTEHIAPIRVSVADAVRDMVAEIPHEGTVTFKSLTVGMTDRIAIVVRFLAVLELFKQGLVEIDQVDTFGDIHVSWLTGADLADIDLIDVYEG